MQISSSHSVVHRLLHPFGSPTIFIIIIIIIIIGRRRTRDYLAFSLSFSLTWTVECFTGYRTHVMLQQIAQESRQGNPAGSHYNQILKRLTRMQNNAIHIYICIHIHIYVKMQTCFIKIWHEKQPSDCWGKSVIRGLNDNGKNTIKI